jgi:hypothetical protein
VAIATKTGSGRIEKISSRPISTVQASPSESQPGGHHQKQRDILLKSAFRVLCSVVLCLVSVLMLAGPTAAEPKALAQIT